MKESFPVLAKYQAGIIATSEGKGINDASTAIMTKILQYEIPEKRCETKSTMA